MNLLAPCVLTVAVAVVACGGDAGNSLPTQVVPRGLASCGATTELFSRLPVDPAKIMGWVPLGIMSPPAHTFPTDHQYVYLTTFGTTAAATPLVAPGRVVVTGARRTSYSAGSIGTDYSLTFSPCSDVSAEFGHVTSIEPTLLARLGAFDQQCNRYSPNPGLEVEACYTRAASVLVEAGETIGSTKGLDLWLFDRRVQPTAFANATRWTALTSGFDHFHVAPFSAYYGEPARSTVRAMLGSFDGHTRRVAEPLGGSIDSDVRGTAQGVWFSPGQPTFPETSHLAIAPDNVEPTLMTISFGLSQPDAIPGAYHFVPVSSGDIDRAPSEITPGATIHCWEVGYGDANVRAVVFVQLTDATTLRVETRFDQPQRCADLRPYSFSDRAFRYVR